MLAMPDDISTPRLVLRLMEGAVVDACLAGDLARAGHLLGIAIPGALLERRTALEFAQARLAADPRYRPWSIRAMILPATRSMVGHIRFHSCPDPDELRPYARAAIEFGYRVFPEHRRRGYATEAASAMMGFAQAHGVERFVVSVSPDNAPSLALIARFGFARIGEHMDEVDGLEHVYLREASSQVRSATAGPT
jgi:RimJ/RimL family protein N-acetyltransferase